MARKQIERVLDRRIPPDFKHVELYPANALRKIKRTVTNVEMTKIPLPKSYHRFYDQTPYGACVGFGESLCMSIYNNLRFDAMWLYLRAQLRDPWAETPPEEGTSLSAGFDVLREEGHRYFLAKKDSPPKIKHGIVAVNRWTNSVDEDRTAIAEGHPVVDGINWMREFDVDKLIHRTVKLRNGHKRAEWWIPEPDKWTRSLGGHCILRPLASDQRQAFGWLNSWGESYPWPVWISYEGRAKLQEDYGESAIVTDR